MTSYRITYEGPSSLAVETATALADAEGIELTSAGQLEHPHEPGGAFRLAVTVEGTLDAVTAAVAGVRADLPEGAAITVDGARD